MGKFSVGSSKEFLGLAKNYDFFFSSQRGQIIENISQATDSKYTYSKEQSVLDSNLKTNPGYQRANKGWKNLYTTFSCPLYHRGLVSRPLQITKIWEPQLLQIKCSSTVTHSIPVDAEPSMEGWLYRPPPNLRGYDIKLKNSLLFYTLE